MPRNLYPTAVAVYAALLPGLRERARALGYVLALHGSMTTDLDLVAVPWTETAAPAEDLIEALRAHVGGNIRQGPYPSCTGCAERGIAENCEHVGLHNPSPKPHGRRAWSIHLAGESGPYLDVSVMPRSGD